MANTVIFHGEETTIPELCRKYSIHDSGIRARLNDGATIDEAVERSRSYQMLSIFEEIKKEYEALLAAGHGNIHFTLKKTGDKGNDVRQLCEDIIEEANKLADAGINAEFICSGILYDKADI